MKKFFLIIAIFATLPVFAMCSIEEGAEVCSLPGFREKVGPVYNPQSGIREFSSTPEARLSPVKRNDTMKDTRNFGAIESNFNYNSNCQFGICLQDNSKPIFNQLN